MHLQVGQPHLRSQDQPTPADLDGVLGPLFEQATTPMVAIGMDHRILRANLAFCQLVGRSAAELRGTHILDITHPDDRLASQTVMRRSRRGKPVSGLVKRYLRPSGDPVWVRITTSVLRDGDERAICTFTQAENVTGERELQHRLHQLEQLRTALAESNEAMLRATSGAGLWQEACRIAVQYGGLKMAWLGLVGDDGWVVPGAIWGEDQGYLLNLRTSTSAKVPEGLGPVGRAARSRRPAVFQDIETEPSFRPWLDRARVVGFRGVACFPMMRAKRVRGILTVYSDEPQFFDDEALNLLGRLAANVEFAWETLDDRAEQARSARETKDMADRFHHLFERTGIASATLTADLNLTQVNQALADLLGRRAEDLVGTSLLDFVPTGEHRQLLRHHRKLQRHPEKGLARVEHCVVTATGQLRWLLASSTIMPALASRDTGIFWQAQDITRQHRAEEAATRRSGQQAAIAEFGQYALAVRDLGLLIQRASVLLAQHLEVPKASVLRWNGTHDSFRFVAGVGWEPGVVGNALIPGGQQSLAGFTIRCSEAVLVSDFTTEDRFHEGDLQQIYGIRSGLGVPIVAGDQPYGVLEAFTVDRHEFNDDDSHFAQGLAHVLGTAITRQEDDATLQQQAWHDALTGLPNRVLLLDRIPAALSRAQRGDQLAALLFVDLDRLKVVNDSLGHAAGDEVLRTVAQRFQRLIRPSDTIARVGADEFAALAEDLGSPAMAMLMGERLVKAVEAPILVHGQEVVITASVGVRTTAEAALDADELLRDADIAMYHAKAAGGRRAVEFTSAMGGIFGDRVKLEADLHRALANHEFVVLYQPVVGLEEGQIVGAEALLRWDHPERGLVSPADFIPLAEETGIIVDIGAWVLGEACAACARWSRLLPESQPLVSVNLSTRQLLDPQVVEMVAAALRKEDLPSALLCMEITETALLADSLAAVSALDEIRTLGVQLALDDFGTGYSSVAHLKRFNLDHMKLDKIFIDNVDSDPKDAAIVGGLIQLAHAIGLTAVAEGVETAGQMATLKRLGCDAAQGYLMSPAVPAAEFERLWVTRVSY
ncbi:MAG: EAL domain-containing protein [Candidatus Dormibacteraeota bacterium]|nr:EAL domain-containing protein [Candidatus Dormibacteraeota bacterium]